MKQDNAIVAERVQILYAKATISISTALVSAFVLTLLFRGQLSPWLLWPWFAGMVIVALIRFWLVRDYERRKNKSQNHQHFEDRFVYSTALVGLAWASLILLGLNLPEFKLHIYILLFLGATMAIDIPIFSTSIKTLYAYIAPQLLIAAPALLIHGGDDLALGLGVIIFAGVLIRSSKNVYETLVDNFSARIQAQALAESLTQMRDDKIAGEQRMQGILDFAPAIIYAKNLSGQFTFLNQKAADLLQVEREELMGKTMDDILPEKLAKKTRENDLEVIKKAKPIKYEEKTSLADGLHHYLSIKFPLFDEAGVVNGVGGVSSDITDRVHAEESLRLSQQRLLLHREQSPLGVVEWNTVFEFIDWNPAAERIFGFTKEEVLGKHITKTILSESSVDVVNEVWAKLISQKGGSYSLNENITKDGRTITCEWHNTPLVDSEGKVIGVTSLVDDVTERELNEESLRQTQKMDAIGKLTGGIAHDFNNMLGVILGFSELLKANVKGDQPKQLKYCNEILHAGERAAKLTSKLLDFSRKTPSYTEKVDINKLLQGMHHMLEKTLTKRINLVFDLGESLWPAMLEQTRLEDSILNICINSMHAMPDGGTLTLSTRNMYVKELDDKNMGIGSGDYVLLSIRDTGMGMSQEVQQKMFEPFYTSKGTEGTGLGLSQVYGFVQQSNGHIQVYSELGHGTRTVLYFPKVLETANIQEELSINETKKYPEGSESILIVEDEEALQELTEEILSSHGYNVYCANDGEQALKMLQDKTVDLMLSDVIMPGIDGYSLANEVKKAYPSIKIQMVSGYSGENKVAQENESLHLSRIHKPFTAEKLLRRIRSLLDEAPTSKVIIK